MTTAELRRFVEDGLSILVGTVGADGEPSCTRGLAVTGNEDLTRLTVYLPVNTAQQAIANVATSRRLAVVVSNPLDHSTGFRRAGTPGWKWCDPALHVLFGR